MKIFANCAIGIIWLILRHDIRSLRLITTESLEHYFGHIRTWNADFNILEFNHFCKKLDRILTAMYNSIINSGRGQPKGYLSKFGDYRA